MCKPVEQEEEILLEDILLPHVLFIKDPETILLTETGLCFFRNPCRHEHSYKCSSMRKICHGLHLLVFVGEYYSPPEDSKRW